jgi:hypothetical protein
MVRRATRMLVPMLGISLAIYSCAESAEQPSNTRGSAGKAAGGAKAGGVGVQGGGEAGDAIGGSGGRGTGATGGVAGKNASGGKAGRTAGAGRNAGSSGSAGGGVSGSGGGAHGCASPSAWSSNLVGCVEGYVHRPTDSACSLSPRDGSAGEGSTAGAPNHAPCETDVDCSAAPDGYCVNAEQTSSGRVCIYACRTDADCGTGELCACDDSWTSVRNQAPIEVGRCIPATCRTDDECGGSLCVASLESVCFQVRQKTVEEFHCQSGEDECNGAEDCVGQSGAGGVASLSCHYDGAASRFTCGGVPECRVVTLGRRPHLDHK